jgi:hypothetical protein
MGDLKMKYILLFALLFIGEQVVSQNKEYYFENPSDYPLIGNWTGKWINPQKGHEQAIPDLTAQIDVGKNNVYIIRFLPQLYKRATLYLEVTVDLKNDELVWEKDGWKFTFHGDSCTGYGNLHGEKVLFYLMKNNDDSPTLGLKAPGGAVKLFDDKDLKHWQHSDGRELTWKNDSGVLETVSEFWNNGKNRETGIGGSIETKQKFGDLQFHMEFRYPVEAGKTGQDRGNSGLFFFGIGEIQILNSYALTGYWDDCGSIYKQTPPTVNASGPPLQWQTYDVELLLPKFDNSGKKISNALLTVWLNGILIHNKLEIVTDANKVNIGLQDHINCLQYRNIWVNEF